MRRLAPARRSRPEGSAAGPLALATARPVLAAACALLLLAACTGTKEPRPATLLIVGAAPGGSPRLLLVEDVTGSARPGEPRLVVVPGSSRALPAPAVALDLEDRGLERPAAWVLTRRVEDAGGAPAVTAYLHRFRVTEVDPADPAAFAEDAGRRVTLTTPGGDGVLDGLSPTSPTTCPTALQVDRSGSWAVVLDDPARCGGDEHPEVWLVPLGPDGGEPIALQATNDVAPLAPYVDQRPVQQVAYFLVGGISTTSVYRYVLGQDGSAERLEGVSLPARAEDLAAATGAGDLLLAVADDELLAVDLARPGPAVRSGTVDGAVALAADPTGLAPEVLALTGAAVAFHEDVQDRSPDRADRPAVAAAVDPVTRFAYAVGEGRLTVLDLLTGGATDRSFQAYTEPLAELVLPSGAPSSLVGADAGPVTVIGWVRAKAQAEP